MTAKFSDADIPRYVNRHTSLKLLFLLTAHVANYVYVAFVVFSSESANFCVPIYQKLFLVNHFMVLKVSLKTVKYDSELGTRCC